MHPSPQTGAVNAAPHPGDPALRPARLQRAWQGAPGLLAVCLVGAAVSWVWTGHLLGQGNNVFHLPLLADLAAQPGMADDAFVQSLARFQSGLWVLLRGSDAVVPATLLLPLLLFATKALTLYALLLLAGELGLRGRLQQLGFVAVMASTPLLRGTAYAGHGGLFIDYFSHSELATALTLLLWWACLRGRFGLALALNGAVFFLNGFMAVWNLAPWLWLALRAWRADPAWLRRQLPGLLAGGAVVAALAGAVLWRAAGAGQLSAATGGPDHRDFLRDYYPYHFLASEMPLAQWLGLAAVGLAAALALRALRALRDGASGPAAPMASAAGLLAQVGLAYGAVYAVGLVLPWLTASPLWLNLHLLRVSVFFHLLAALALGVWLLRAAQSPEPTDRLWRAPWLAVALLTVRPALLALPLALALQRLWPGLCRLPVARLRGVAAGVAALALIGGVAALVAERSSQARLQQSLADWAQVAKDVKQRTQPGDVVMLPLDTGRWQPADAGSGAFQYHAQRPVWVDHKRGAAVFWQSDYWPQWQTRTAALRPLTDWASRLRHAQAHGVAVVVDDCAGLPDLLPSALLARAGRLCAVGASASVRLGGPQ